MASFLRLLNDNHHFIFAALITAALFFWTWGCESTCKSLLDESQTVNRLELTAEIEYLAKIADSRVADLNKQDEIKQALYDSLVVISQGGQINAMGVLNLAATIGAISFGLNRNKKLNNALSASEKSG